METNKKKYSKGSGLSVAQRIIILRKLRESIIKSRKQICEALFQDLGKGEFESLSTEITIVTEHISYLCHHLKKWSRPQSVKCTLLNWPAQGEIYSEPYGHVLIFSSWNYPFQLLLMPLIDAFAAGNEITAKPAEQAPATAVVCKNLIESNFSEAWVRVCCGGLETSVELLKLRYDYIFYTGGKTGGKLVAESAAQYLTPITLELGGKSPCIIDKDAPIELSAKRLVWGKFLNAGQTCVAPDYLLVHCDIKKILIERMKYYIQQFYGNDPLKSPDYSNIVNAFHFQRLEQLAEDYSLCKDREKLRIAPTIIEEVSLDSPLMQEEIFGPLLPVIEYSQIKEVIEFLEIREKPLALYYFGYQNQKKIIYSTRSGSVGINECVMQMINENMPFGGVGQSGIGAYHGKWSYETFTHQKSVMKKATWIDFPIRYPPNLSKKIPFLKWFLRT